jgi:hypothetical protein
MTAASTQVIVGRAMSDDSWSFAATWPRREPTGLLGAEDLMRFAVRSARCLPCAWALANGYQNRRSR